MLMRLFILSSVCCLLLACGKEDDAVPMGVTAPPPAPPPPQTLFLSDSGLACSSLEAAVQTLDYLRRSVGQGELRGNCVLTEPGKPLKVVVTQAEFMRVTQLAPQLDKIVFWRADEGARTGFSPLIFLNRKHSSAYPMRVTGSSTMNRAAAYLAAEDLRRLIAVDPRSQEAGNLQVEIMRSDRLTFQAVDGHPLEILAMVGMPNHLGVGIMSIQWRFIGKPAVYWSRLVDVLEHADVRAKFADRWASR